jgi:hypothetical protein
MARLREKPVLATSHGKTLVMQWKGLFPRKLRSNSLYSYVGDLCRIVHAKLVNFDHLFGNEFGHRISAINQAKRTQGKFERTVQQFNFFRIVLAAPQQAIDWHSSVPIHPKETPGRLDFYPARNKEKSCDGGVHLLDVLTNEHRKLKALGLAVAGRWE